MIITIGGTAGSGKSTIAKLLAKKFDYNHYSMGDFQRDIAEEVDQRQIELGREKDNFIIDSRLGFHFIPNSIKIFLDADFEERAKRILADKIRKEHNVNLENTKENMKLRKSSEQKRYKDYYNIDPYDKSNYDLVIDTTSISPEEIVEKILEFVKNK